MFDITRYFRPGDPFLAGNTLEDVIRGYQFKHAVAAMLAAAQERPLEILEVGVRAGYSAAAFLAACPTATYVGLDADSGQHGGEPGYSDWAREMLSSHFPDARIRIETHDSQERGLPTSPGYPSLGFDLVHVDGDHSEAGCLRDLEQAARVARWVLVDDVDHILDVERAVARFLLDRQPPEVRRYRKGDHEGSLRGDVLIRVR